MNSQQSSQVHSALLSRRTIEIALTDTHMKSRTPWATLIRHERWELLMWGLLEV